MVSVMSQFINNPTEEHMEGVYRVLRYLKRTPGKGLVFRKTSLKTSKCTVTQAPKLTDVLPLIVWGNLVTWSSKKQSVVARGSAEAEYRALVNEICEGIWLKRVLRELKLEDDHPVELMCDNQATIRIA